LPRARSLKMAKSSQEGRSLCQIAYTIGRLELRSRPHPRGRLGDVRHVVGERRGPPIEIDVIKLFSCARATSDFGHRMRALTYFFKQAINILLLDLLIPPRRYFSEQSRLYLYILLFSTFPIGATYALVKLICLAGGLPLRGCVCAGASFTQKGKVKAVVVRRLDLILLLADRGLQSNS